MPINDGNGGNLSDTFGNSGTFSGNPMTGGYANQGGGFGGFFQGGYGTSNGGSLLGNMFGNGYGQPSPYPGGYVAPVQQGPIAQPYYTTPAAPSLTIPDEVPISYDASYFGDIPSAVSTMADMAPPQVDLTQAAYDQLNPSATAVPPQQTTPQFEPLPGPVPQAIPSPMQQSTPGPVVNSALKTDNLSIQQPVKTDFMGGSLLGQPMATAGPPMSSPAAVHPSLLGGALPSAPAGMSFTGAPDMPAPVAPSAPLGMTHSQQLAALDAYKSPYGPESIALAGGPLGQSGFADAAGTMYNQAGYLSPFDGITPSMGAPAQWQDLGTAFPSQPGLFDGFFSNSPWNARPGSQPSWSRLWN